VANSKQSPNTKTAPDTFLQDMAAMKFSGLKVDISKIDRAWEQQRGAMMRVALLVMRDNHTRLAGKFCHSNEAALTAMTMADQLHEEADFLKEGVKILEAAISRLMAVAARRQFANECEESAHG
jgi:hypothetical protein